MADREYQIWVATGARILQNGIVQLDISRSSGAIQPRPGQFYLLKPKRGAFFLGRPISAAAWFVHPESQAPTIRFLIALKGGGTQELGALKPGDEVYATGPLGNSWLDMPPRSSQSAALVGGGIGIAPLLAFAGELEAKSFDFYAGFRSAPFGLEDLRSRRTIIATEDGSAGNRGLIPQFFDPAGYSAVYACGPIPMLKVIAQSCEQAGTPCYISLERPMACGVGVCLGCVVTTRDGNRRCCTEGPIFPAEEVIFE